MATRWATVPLTEQVVMDSQHRDCTGNPPVEPEVGVAAVEWKFIACRDVDASMPGAGRPA